MTGFSDLLLDTLDALVSGFHGLLIPGVVFLLLCFLVKGRAAIASVRKCTHSSLFNISVMSINIVLLSPVLVLLYQWFMVHEIALINSGWVTYVPDIGVIFLAIFIGDFVGYWRHRFEHLWLLWPSHMLHHSDGRMSWLTLQRFHPINRLSTFLIDGSVLLVLGFPPFAIIANNFVRHYYGYFIHADLPWTYGRWGKIFVSPVMHRWHHALDSAYHHKNFATVFSLFDRCFGTYEVPGICRDQLGCKVRGKQVGLAGQLLYPFKPSSYYK